MRKLSLAAAMLVTAAISPAHAEWKQYQDKSLGIYVYFPVPPSRTSPRIVHPSRPRRKAAL